MLCVPLRFVCETLEVLNHLALLRVRVRAPVSGGQEATETRLVHRELLSWHESYL